MSSDTFPFVSLLSGYMLGFPGGASGKENACQCRRHKRCGLDAWVGRITKEGHSNTLQYSCLDNPMDKGPWWATVHGVTKSQTQLKQLSMYKEYSGCQFNTPDSVSGKGLTWVEEGYLVAGNEYPSVSSSEIAIQFI